MPERIKAVPVAPEGRSTELTAGARRFLWNMAVNAHQEHEASIIAAQQYAATEDSGSESEEDHSRLAWDALRQILSVLTPTDEAGDPWSDPPSFKVSTTTPQRSPDHDTCRSHAPRRHLQQSQFSNRMCFQWWL